MGSLTLWVVLILLNIASHFFLVRFFKWHNEKSKLNRTWVKWVLLVPPVALTITVSLIGLGFLMKVLKK